MGAAARTIDLNADLGEGMGDDDAMLALVSSANIACGGHAGDAATMRRLCAIARARGVRIGAHVSYADREGFGRRRIDVPAPQLRAELAAQLDALDAAADAAGTRVRFVKPHGALYNVAADDAAVAAVVVEVAAARAQPLAVMGFPDSELLRLAHAAGLAVITEAFADRAYDTRARLVDRSVPGAVNHDRAGVVAQALALATRGVVTALDGSPVAVRADSLCLHGDTPGAVALATAVRDALADAGVAVARWG